MLWLLPLLLVFLLLAWLLLAPMRLKIDTEQSLFRLEWQTIGSVAWLPGEALEILELRVFFLRRKLHLDKAPWATRGKKREKTDKPSKKKPVNISAKRMIRLSLNVLRSFRVRRFDVCWDTDDFALNARLYPLAVWASVAGWPVRINFQGRREFALTIENRLARIAWAVLKTFFIK